MDFPLVSVTQQLQQITIRRNQVIIVALQTKFNDGNPEFVNVELRVCENGTPEIFCDTVQTKPFSEWTNPERNTTPGGDK